MKTDSPRTIVGACVGAAFLTVAWSVGAAVGPAKAEDIRDIRPLILIPPWWQWLAAALAAAAVLAVTGVVVRLWRRRSKRPLTPEEQAREALSQAESLARRGRTREWANVVARTLRNALAARVGKSISPQTTSELARVEWANLPSGADIDAPRLLDLLTTCDLARFAMARLEADSLLASTESARDWITRLFAPPKTTAQSTAKATR